MSDQTVMPDAPECARMVAASEDSHKIGEFLDWLSEQGIMLASYVQYTDTCERQSGPIVVPSHRSERLGGEGKWQCKGGRFVGHPASNKPGEDGGECDRCHGTGEVPVGDPRLAPISEGFERLLARYFEIDLALVETERRALLAALRS